MKRWAAARLHCQERGAALSTQSSATPSSSPCRSLTEREREILHLFQPVWLVDRAPVLGTGAVAWLPPTPAPTRPQHVPAEQHPGPGAAPAPPPYRPPPCPPPAPAPRPPPCGPGNTTAPRRISATPPPAPPPAAPAAPDPPPALRAALCHHGGRPARRGPRAARPRSAPGAAR